jgi:hypothetical protein
MFTFLLKPYESFAMIVNVQGRIQICKPHDNRFKTLNDGKNAPPALCDLYSLASNIILHIFYNGKILTRVVTLSFSFPIQHQQIHRLASNVMFTKLYDVISKDNGLMKEELKTHLRKILLLQG